MGKIYVVGIGPGNIGMMTDQARRALDLSDVIVGYKTYTGLVKEYYPEKEYFENGMSFEAERCEKCVELAKQNKTVALICSGDAGVYGMASPLLQIADREGFDDVEIIPGVTAALSASAYLGAPLADDFCVISLSDHLTPWELIERRLKCAADADLCMAIYNPASSVRPDHFKKACDLLLTKLAPDTACGLVRNIGRDGCGKTLCTLAELSGMDVDMSVTVIIGNSKTRICGGRLITPRGYKL